MIRKNKDDLPTGVRRERDGTGRTERCILKLVGKFINKGVHLSFFVLPYTSIMNSLVII